MILHFQNARLVDPEAQAVEPSTLTIRNGRIEAVGAHLAKVGEAANDA